jgi:DeoR family transcriptional regulator, glycerol-3-phosphate regulon repressor
MSILSTEQLLVEAGVNKRQELILEIVRAKGFATIDSLAEEFGVSTQTVRRDIIRLNEAGLLQRFHGGAGLPQGEDQVRLGYGPKREMHVASKEQIGALAASLIDDRSSVYLDVGTTVEAVARVLIQRSLRAVYTNSMASAVILSAATQFETYVTGGMVRGADGSLVGDAAVQALQPIAVDVAVIGCSGFAADGAPMDFDPQKVAVKQTALRNARRAILVADASKFARPAVVLVAPLATFAAIVTDGAPPASLARQFRKAGISVAIAD